MYLCVCVCVCVRTERITSSLKLSISISSKLDLLSSDTFKNQINGNDQLFKINTIIRSIITIQFSGHKKI